MILLLIHYSLTLLWKQFWYDYLKPIPLLYSNEFFSDYYGALDHTYYSLSDFALFGTHDSITYNYSLTGLLHQKGYLLTQYWYYKSMRNTRYSKAKDANTTIGMSLVPNKTTTTN